MDFARDERAFAAGLRNPSTESSGETPVTELLRGTARELTWADVN